MDIIAHLGKLSAKEIHKKFINYQAKLFLRGYSPSIQIGHISGGIASIGGLFTQPQDGKQDLDLSQLDYNFDQRLDQQVEQNQERLNEKQEEQPIAVQNENAPRTRPFTVIEIRDKEKTLFEAFNEGDPYDSLQIQMAEAFENAENPKHESTVEFLEALSSHLKFESKGGGKIIRDKLEQLKTAETIPKLSLTADDIKYLLTKNPSYKKLKNTYPLDILDYPAFQEKDIFQFNFQDMPNRFDIFLFKKARPPKEQEEAINAVKFNKLLKDNPDYTQLTKLKQRTQVTNDTLQKLMKDIEESKLK